MTDIELYQQDIEQQVGGELDRSFMGLLIPLFPYLFEVSIGSREELTMGFQMPAELFKGFDYEEMKPIWNQFVESIDYSVERDVINVTCEGICHPSRHPSTGYGGYREFQLSSTIEVEITFKPTVWRKPKKSNNENFKKTEKRIDPGSEDMVRKF
jgi:hypothetical protein